MRGVGGNARRHAITSAANGARRGSASVSVASPLGAPLAVVNVTHRSTPAQRSDQWAFWPLGVHPTRVRRVRRHGRRVMPRRDVVHGSPCFALSVRLTPFLLEFSLDFEIEVA
jgi:hypothetical protein